MSALAARIEKEARPLIWVWGALIVFRIIALVPVGSLTVPLLLLRPITFWIGIPLLATLSLGHEFQHGTISLLLSQPMDRMKVWREKWIVLLPAVASVACMYLLDTTDGLLWIDRRTPVIAVVWIVIAVCTSTFWTLVGRSTLNGLLLNILQGFGIFMAWQLAESFWTPGNEFRHALPWLAGVAGLGYSFLMLWLGWRKLARFEVTGVSSGTDLLAVGPRATRGHFAGLFLCVPTQPILNLIRKELRLLWVVWVLILVCVFGVLGLAVFRFRIFPTGIFIIAMAASAAILAGSISMGEERTLGTQSSNRMLPVSSAVQWLIKLTVILFVSCLGLILPVAVAQVAFARDFVRSFDAPLFLYAVPSLLSIAAFFCASAVKDTVRAALLVVPAIGIVLLASEASLYLLVQVPIFDAVTLRFHPFPFSSESSLLQLQLRTDIVLMAIAIPLMLIQSYRLFRLEIQQSLRPVSSSLLWMALLASVFVTVCRIPTAADQQAVKNLWRTIHEIQEITAHLPGDLIPQGETNSRQLTLEELSRVSHLSRKSLTLLRDSSISVSRDAHDLPPGYHSDYTTIVRLRNGRSFSTDGFGIEVSFPFP